MRKNGLSGWFARLSAIALGMLSFGNAAADVRFDGTTSLQAALDAGAGGKVTIAKGVWRVDPAFIRDRSEPFSFDAPKAGWYILYHTPGRNGFYLTGCDAPILFLATGAAGSNRVAPACACRNL